ncbi:hypothetical protein DTO271D3_740 [Paecilomyces variotii]|nr:hypothetical protein DTO169C6_8147 [Paecilomyces variotii]KAJ9231102.1 hypothetical protein DTO169E5_8136 [Paecilomyces variotii]KAJ9319152.1 hypothetical protein DTO271D3_740 [Paecilomyces variotii]KAJ9361899.1 hypothetical protein DTO027B9_330 [Paecilomyces variotii]
MHVNQSEDSFLEVFDLQPSMPIPWKAPMSPHPMTIHINNPIPVIISYYLTKRSQTPKRDHIDTSRRLPT